MVCNLQAEVKKCENDFFIQLIASNDFYKKITTYLFSTLFFLTK